MIWTIIYFHIDDDPSKVPLKDDVDEAAKSTVCPDDIREQDEEVLSNDDSLESSEDEFVGSITVKQQKQSHARRSNKQSNRVRKGHVSLKFTLAFCYLGLLWINEPVFLSDLMRFVQNGHKGNLTRKVWSGGPSYFKLPLSMGLLTILYSFLFSQNALWLQNNGWSTVTKRKEIWWYLNISCWKRVFLVTVIFCIKVLSTVIVFAKECISTDESNSTWNGLYPQYLACVYVLVTQLVSAHTIEP